MNDTIERIVEAFKAVRDELGLGFNQSVYVRALAVEMFAKRMNVAREVPVTVFFKGVTVGTFRADLLVNDAVVVMVSVAPRPVSLGEQVLMPFGADDLPMKNYLRCANKRYGLLLHCGPCFAIERFEVVEGQVRHEPVSL